MQLALDDFGAGYASLSYFRRLPIDTVKIDNSFVINMLDSADDLAIVESVIYLGRRFGIDVMAEGVETQRHVERLRRIGCRLGQGFGFARPMPAVQFRQWLKDWERQRSSV